jgi:hypothetical protein
MLNSGAKSLTQQVGIYETKNCWDASPEKSMVDRHQCYVGTFCLHLQGRICGGATLLSNDILYLQKHVTSQARNL